MRAFFVALLVTYFLGSSLATQVILGELRAMGMPVTLTDHFRATAHDLLGLSRSYLPLLALALGCGLPVAGVLGRRWNRLRPFLYPLAGAAAVVTLHRVVELLLGLNGLAAVREWHGLALQALAGWVGGYVFCMALGFARR